MNGCIYRTKDGECDLYAEGGKYTAFCDLDNCKGRKMSNADRIRAMSDEELSDFLISHGSCTGLENESKCLVTDAPFCDRCWLDWLKEEAEGGE